MLFIVSSMFHEPLCWLKIKESLIQLVCLAYLQLETWRVPVGILIVPFPDKFGKLVSFFSLKSFVYFNATQ